MDTALVPVDVLASDICEDIGDSNERFHFRIKKKLLEGFGDINKLIGQSLDFRSVVLSCDGTAPLPEDFIYETKVGLLRNGRIAIMDLDKNVVKPQVCKSDTELEYSLNQIWDNAEFGPDFGYSFYNCFRDGNSLGELYGWGGGFRTSGLYKINRAERVIEFGSLIPDDAEIVIEYKSTGLADGFKLVPYEFVPAMKYFAKSEFYSDSNAGQSDRNRGFYEREYYKLKRIYNHRAPSYLAWLFKQHDRPAAR